MIAVRRAEERGATQIGWLDSRQTFSFADYRDLRHQGFGALRVINEDRVRPGAGFDTHGHRDMEIISYVLEGALEHKDSLGTGSVIRPGEVQIMSAGTGIRHSEFNPSRSEPVHFLQIWVLPDRQGLAPRYDQKSVPDSEKRGRFRLVGSRDGRDGSVTIHRDVDLYATLLSAGETVTHQLPAGRGAWVQVARGSLLLNGERLAEGDGVSVSAPGALCLEGVDDAEALLFDMAV
jgi:hypothetical protein